MRAPIRVRSDVVTAIHRRQLAEHGGQDGIRDTGLLESALNKPKNLYNYTDPKPSLGALAASYAYGIALNHPFIDGNKRTAFIVCKLFLALNGKILNADPKEEYKTFILLASSKLSEASLAEWIKSYVKYLVANKG